MLDPDVGVVAVMLEPNVEGRLDLIEDSGTTPSASVSIEGPLDALKADELED